MSSGISSCFLGEAHGADDLHGVHSRPRLFHGGELPQYDAEGPHVSLFVAVLVSEHLGAIHSGVPAFVFELRYVFRLTRDNPKSHTLTTKLLSTRRFGDLRSLCTIIGSNECK